MRRLTLPLICLLCLLALPAVAQAKVRVGFSEQQAAMFDDPLFKDLGTRQARLIVSYDAVLKNTFEVADIDKWMAGARANGVRRWCRSTTPRLLRQRQDPEAPGVQAAERRDVHEGVQGLPRALSGRQGHLALERDQPLLAADVEEPQARGAVHDGGEEELRGCTIVAADMLDQRGLASYLTKFKRALKGTYRVWALHNYSDTNRFRDKGTKQYLRNVPGQVWLTETGGVVTFGSSFPFDVDRAAKATKFMFKLAASNRPSRACTSTSGAGPTPGDRFDAGVIGPDGSPRPAYDVIKKALGR